MMAPRAIRRAACALAGALLCVPPAEAVAVSYLYNLSDFSGTVPYDDVKLYADRRNDEVYAATGNSIRVFNASGMEAYRFDVDPRPGTVFDLAVEESGDLLLLTLSFDPARPGAGWFIARCDYRGDPVGRVTIANLPEELAAFRPNVLIDRGERLVLASLAQFQAVEIDRSGRFHRAFDLAKILGMKESERSKNDIAGFSMDARGNMLVSVPTMFKVFVIVPGGGTRSFGRAGSSPGAFGNIAGVVADERGNVIVADKARGVVMIFDDRLEFVTEFGSGDDGRPALTRPTDLALGPSGKLYVTQARERGVAVFKLDAEGETKGARQEREAGGTPHAKQRGVEERGGEKFSDRGARFRPSRVLMLRFGGYETVGSPPEGP